MYLVLFSDEQGQNEEPEDYDTDLEIEGEKYTHHFSFIYQICTVLSNNIT